MRKKRKSVVWMAAVAAVVACVMVVSGCGYKGNGNASNTNGVKSQSYGNDGYLGMTNSYPRIPGRNMASNYKADNNLMQQAIKNVPGVRGSNVIFNGAEAYVTIKLAPDLQTQEISTVEREAAAVLRFNFPSYTIHVSSMKK
jgi:hypothetical protein